ncbi:MAG: alpha/beta hydrolase [Chloroflexota bacterium]|nr:alpha/beta hydrolase [Chloroflexota bacterium]
MVQAIKRDEVFIEPEGIHVETQQPERRSRKPPVLMIHGALTGSWVWAPLAGYLAERGWECHALNLRGHYTSDVADLASVTMDDYVADVGVAIRAIGRPAILFGWGLGALVALRYAERRPVLGLVLLAPSPPAAAQPRGPLEHELKAIPPVYDARVYGWEAPVDRLRERMPDLTDVEIEKVRELLSGARESGRARRERMLGYEIDADRITVPTLVLAGGRDELIEPSIAERTAQLVGGTFELLPEASHFGLVMGASSWPEVARLAWRWLEEHRVPARAAG